MASSFDVAVLGGGPAGCATAIALCQLGHRCVVIEKSDYAQAWVGETLAPSARRSLVELGLWERFVAAGHLPCATIRSAWGTDEPAALESIFNPYGHGWHLDRLRFDAWLAQAAVSAGAQLCCEAQLMACKPDGSSGWEVEIAAPAGRRRIRANFIVDATGRSASFARRQGARRIALDRLVGIVAHYRAPPPTPGSVGHLLVEAVETGWWYSAPLPDSRIVVTFMTDADLHAHAHHPAGVHAFARLLAQTAHSRHRVRGCSLDDDRPRVVAAHGARLSAIRGPGWLAVGDAAAARDPLSGQGISSALQSGVRAASAISACLSGDSGAMRDHEAKVRADADRYLELRRVFYAREARWPAAAFWRRRHVDGRADVKEGATAAGAVLIAA